MAPSLAQLFAMSLSVGCFPDYWKTARVARFLSKARKMIGRIIGLYRCYLLSLVYLKSLSITTCTTTLTKQDAFSDQSGFRALHSVLTSLLKCTNDWYLNIDKYTAVVYIDLKKALDTVDHDILLRKLNFCGLKGKELN